MTTYIPPGMPKTSVPNNNNLYCLLKSYQALHYLVVLLLYQKTVPGTYVHTYNKNWLTRLLLRAAAAALATPVSRHPTTVSSSDQSHQHLPLLLSVLYQVLILWCVLQTCNRSRLLRRTCSTYFPTSQPFSACNCRRKFYLLGTNLPEFLCFLCFLDVFSFFLFFFFFFLFLRVCCC